MINESIPHGHCWHECNVADKPLQCCICWAIKKEPMQKNTTDDVVGPRTIDVTQILEGSKTYRLCSTLLVQRPGEQLPHIDFASRIWVNGILYVYARQVWTAGDETPVFYYQQQMEDDD